MFKLTCYRHLNLWRTYCISCGLSKFGSEKNTGKSANVFDEMGSYWAEIAQENQTEKQIQFITNTLRPNGWVLDLACGTGRHTNVLSSKRYSVVGLDISSALLRMAHKRSLSTPLFRGDMRYLPFKSAAFSSIISMDTSLGYLPSEKDDLQSLKEVKRTLSKEGLFLLDIFNREYLIQKYPKVFLSKIAGLRWLPLSLFLRFPNRLKKPFLFRFYKWKEYPDFFLLQKRTVSVKGDRLCDLWVICDKKTGQISIFNHSARLYELPRLREMLKTAGLMVDGVFGGYGKEEFTCDSKRLIVMGSVKKG